MDFKGKYLIVTFACIVGGEYWMERSLVNSFRQCLSWGTFSGEQKQQQNKENGVTTRLDIIFQFNIPCRECDLKIQLFLICVYSCWKIMCCHGILDSFLRKILSFCSFSWHCPCFCNNFITHVVSCFFLFNFSSSSFVFIWCSCMIFIYSTYTSTFINLSFTAGGKGAA